MKDLSPEKSADGVDVTLIRWMLDLTPEQRLAVLDNYVKDVLEIREANGIR